MRFLIDNNLPLSLAGRLREIGHEAVHVREIGHRDSADTTLIRLGIDRSEIIVTQDNDFPQLLALAKAQRPSVILLRPGAPTEPSEIVELLSHLSESAVQSLESGAVISVDHRGERIRELPFG